MTCTLQSCSAGQRGDVRGKLSGAVNMEQRDSG